MLCASVSVCALVIVVAGLEARQPLDSAGAYAITFNRGCIVYAFIIDAPMMAGCRYCELCVRSAIM